MRVLVAHPGTQYSHHLARELHSRKLLDSFHTCLAFSSESMLAARLGRLMSPLGLERLWLNRLLEGVPPRKVRNYPLLELRAMLALKRGHPVLATLRRRNEQFQRKVTPDGAETVIGFDTSSRILAQKTKAAGQRFILDRSIGHARHFDELDRNLREKYPAWSNASLIKSEDELLAEDEEHEMADLIVVPSRFTRQTLVERGIAADKIRVNPFGTDTTLFSPRAAQQTKGPLVFFFVGALSARKGVPLLLEAWRRLKPERAELWIAGTGDVPETTTLNSVRWLGPLSRGQLPAYFQQADVFVFPSFFEGLAQTQIEAAASGLPMITTFQAGGEDVIQDTVTGYLIEPDVEQLIDRMGQFLRQRSLAEEMGERVRARKRDWSWSAYGERWAAILDS